MKAAKFHPNSSTIQKGRSLMVIMTLRLTVPPEKTVEAIEIIKSMTGPISAEPDCKQVSLYSDINNDDALMLVEEWGSQKALQEHIRSDDFRIVLEVMELSVRAPEICFNTISERAGFDLVERMRS